MHECRRCGGLPGGHASGAIDSAADYMIRSHECPDCGDRSRLVVYWDGKQDAVRCGGCRRETGFVKRKSLTQIWRENPDAVPITVANRLAHKHGAAMEAIAKGLPAELAEIARRKYGLPERKEAPECQ